MSQCIAEDRDIRKQFPALYRKPGFPEEPTAVPVKRDLKGRAKHVILGVRRTNKAKVIEDLTKRLDTTIFRLLVTARSKGQFTELRQELFPEFVELSGAISTLLKVIDQHEDQTALADQVFAYLRLSLSSDHWLLGRHTGAIDEAVFCLDTLHRAHFLAQDALACIRDGVLPPESVNEYQAAISQEWWSILHLRCITFSIRHKILPSDEVFLCLLDGFRHSVMAYANAREAMAAKYRADYAGVDFATIGQEVDREYSVE
jgi:hypothetical protein